MKNIISIISLLLVMTSCSKQDEGFTTNIESENLETITNSIELFTQSEDGKVSQVDTDFLKEKWELELKSEGINVQLHQFEIIESISEVDGKSIYFLKAKSKDGTIETGAFIENNIDELETLGLSQKSYMVKSKTCTCKGCPQGCKLTVTGSSCSCSGCPPGSGGTSNCVKTETIVIDHN